MGMGGVCMVGGVFCYAVECKHKVSIQWYTATQKNEMIKVGGAKSGRGGICVYHISAVIPNLKILGKIYTHKPTAKLQSRYF